jgi:uncharacterized membrane protein YtjA (UPF0391 family)
VRWILPDCAGKLRRPCADQPPAQPLAGAGPAEEESMLKWAIIFFIISLVAGLFGFTNIAAGSRAIAKALFFVFLVLFLIVLVFGVFLGMLAF